MISTRSLTPEEKEISDKFNKAGKVLVIKDVTVLNLNKFHTIKVGSVSIEYAYCNYHFLDENSVNCYINSAPVHTNPDYFIPITIKELRKLKLIKINESEKWFDNFVTGFSKNF